MAHIAYAANSSPVTVIFGAYEKLERVAFSVQTFMGIVKIYSQDMNRDDAILFSFRKH